MLTPESKRIDWELACVQSWLSDTAQDYDDWDWDGDFLVIILDGEVVEEYNRQTVEEDVFSHFTPPHNSQS